MAAFIYVCILGIAGALPALCSAKTAVVYAPDEYRYIPLDQFDVRLHPGQTSFQFEVKAWGNAHLALYKHHGDTSHDMYEIVLGWKGNTSEIRVREMGTAVTLVESNPLSSYEYRPFWVSWKDGLILVGSGTEVGRQTFMVWQDSSPHDINFISVSNGWLTTGAWRFKTSQ